MRNRIKRRPDTSAKIKVESIMDGIGKENHRVIVSAVPHDKPDCACLPLIYDYQIKKAYNPALAPMECPADKTDMEQYHIVCTVCKSKVAQLYSADETMSNFCDLHYICETDGQKWFGAFTLNLSPIDGILGIECACGNDTRDFRANKTLSPKQISKIESVNSVGRIFGKPDSKFKLVKKQ